MTVPTLLDYPLHACPLPEERLPLGGADPVPLLLALVKQAFSLIRSSEAWKKGKSYGSPDPAKGGKVLSLSCPSKMEGRLGKCAWHARFSQHQPAQGGLTFEDFFDALATEQHSLNESEYIPDLKEALKIDTLVPGRAEIWRNSYQLPTFTTNRDFLELVVTLPLPPSPAPFSRAHEEVVVRQLATTHRLPSHPGSPRNGRRSFIVISVPVRHHAAPERKGFIRAKYASVEGVWEGEVSAQSPKGERPKIDWFMAVQSDTAGRIPLMFQEMVMASKISQDVSLLFEWYKNRRGRSRRRSSAVAAASASATMEQSAAAQMSTSLTPGAVEGHTIPAGSAQSPATAASAQGTASPSTAVAASTGTDNIRSHAPHDHYNTVDDATSQVPAIQTTVANPSTDTSPLPPPTETTNAATAATASDPVHETSPAIAPLPTDPPTLNHVNGNGSAPGAEINPTAGGAEGEKLTSPH